MAYPRISVVIPNYNYDRFLPLCLEAYFGQTLPPHEVVIVDDGSTDRSREILADYAPRHASLQVLLQERNQGTYAAIERGLRAASGDYVFLSSTDDIPEPFLLENLARLAVDYPQADVVTTNFYFAVYREDGTSFRHPSGIGLPGQPAYYPPCDFEKALRRCWVPVLGIPMYRKSALLPIFRSDFGWWGDYLDVLRVGFRSGMCHSPQPALAFRVDPGSWGCQGRGDPEKNGRLLRHIVREVFTAPEFRPVAASFARSQALCLIGAPVVRALCNGKDWPLLRFVLRPKTLAVALVDLLKRTLRPFIPKSLLEWRRREMLLVKRS